MDDRLLGLSPRLEETREKQVPRVIRFELSDIKTHFDEDIDALRLQTYWIDQSTCDSDDLRVELVLRSQIVLLVSAFDFYLHELTKIGVNKIFEKEWEPSSRYENISLKLKDVVRIIDDEVEADWFIAFINEYYSKVTMVSYDSFKDQMNLMGLKMSEIAKPIFTEAGSSEPPVEKMKKAVNELFNTRNIIAHQSNRNHHDAKNCPIPKGKVDEYIENIVKIVEAIHEAALNHSKN